MTKTKLGLLLNTQALNFPSTFKMWPITVLDPLKDYESIVADAHKARAAIDTDPRLTYRGRVVAAQEREAADVKRVMDLHTPRLAGLDADILAHRTALMPSNVPQPDPRRVDFLLSHLRDRTAQEVATLYGSASDKEKQEMEAAAGFVGRIPMKTEDGGVSWRPLLDPEVINESVMARASATNPEAATKLRELVEIRAMHQTVSTHAVAEIKAVMSLVG